MPEYEDRRAVPDQQRRQLQRCSPTAEGRLSGAVDMELGRQVSRGAADRTPPTDGAVPSQLEQRHGGRARHGVPERRGRRSLLGGASIAEDLRHEHDVRRRDPLCANTRRRLRESPRGGCS